MGFLSPLREPQISGEPETRTRVECPTASHPVFPSQMPLWGLFNRPLTFLKGHWPLRGKPVPCQLPFTAHLARLPWILLGHHHSSSVRIHYPVLVDSPVHPLSEPALLSSVSSRSSLFSICNSVPELSWVPVTASFSGFWTCPSQHPVFSVTGTPALSSFCSALTRFLKSSLLIFISLLGTQKKIGNKVCAFDLVAFLSQTWITHTHTCVCIIHSHTHDGDSI